MVALEPSSTDIAGVDEVDGMPTRTPTKTPQPVDPVSRGRRLQTVRSVVGCQLLWFNDYRTSTNSHMRIVTPFFVYRQLPNIAFQFVFAVHVSQLSVASH